MTAKKWNPTCELTADGNSRTPAELVEWAEAFVSLARGHLGEGPVIGGLWAYRNGGEYICADFRNAATGAYFDMTILVDGNPERRFHLDEPSVPDAAEALHRIGLVAAGLNASIWTVGGCKRGMELNRSVADSPCFRV
jgi:hypothetical protein